MEARRQQVVPIREHAAKDRLAVRRDAAARRQGLAAVGAGAAKALDLLWRPARRPAGRLLATSPRRAATSPLPVPDPEHSEPGGAGVRGRALSGGSPRGARGAGAGPRGAGGPRFELLLGLPKRRCGCFLNAANKESGNQSEDAQALAIQVLVAPPRIAPQLRAQGHVEARRQKVVPLRGHAAKDRLAVRRDAAARRQGLAAGGAGAAKVLDLLGWMQTNVSLLRAHTASRGARIGGGGARCDGRDAAS